ncbi:papilin b, proteoglycan-like sulfated glycoprotein isoform X1 [Brachyhypopomus gauderio]
MLLLSALGVLHLFTAAVLSLRQPSNDHWGEFGPYGECSRTCGTGVAVQTRTCNTMRTDGGHNCVGPSKSYKICNPQECPSSAPDFREEQCSQFNRVDFHGKRYSWLPYYGALNPCELVCVPRGENFYYRHRPAVVDGTPCYVGRRDICVEGVCRAVRHDGLVALDHTPPPTGREPTPAESLSSGVHRYESSGYSECSAACGGGMQTRTVSCLLDSHVVDESQCVAQGLQRPAVQRACNQHACAEYSVGSYSTCSVTCGEGRQEREVVCVGRRGEHLPDHQCSGLERPTHTRVCQRPACQLVLRYHTNDWSLCTRSCGVGSRERRVVCMDQDQNPYEDQRCSDRPRPHAVERCNTQPCPTVQMVPSVQDPTDHERSLQGFVPHAHGEPSVHRSYEPYNPVIGPHCAQSRFGCCPDGHASASGPRGEGCGGDVCSRSRFGCCMDGVTPAQGVRRAGCPESNHGGYSTAHPDVCLMPRDAGTCYDWTSRFSFDSSTNTCVQFWYGGCQGNGNNFVSMEECKQTCAREVRGPVQRERAPSRSFRVRSYRARAA